MRHYGHVYDGPLSEEYERVPLAGISKYQHCLAVCLFVCLLGQNLGLNHVRAAESKTQVNDVIVQFVPTVSSKDVEVLLHQTDCLLVGSCSRSGLHRISVASDHSLTVTVETLALDPRIVYVEPNYRVWTCFEPNDTLFSLQWNLQPATQGGINAMAAWAMQRGDPKVIVAVLDTGVAYENFEEFRKAPDLARTSFVPGYDFVHHDAHPNDDCGHGTHVVGTIAQSTDNGLGVAGIAFGCSIMPVKVVDHNGVGDHFTIASGIYYAVEQGAQVINLSLGGPNDSVTLRNALAFAYTHGVTVVCAAGNDYLKGNPMIYPAAYNDFCLAVGATTYAGTRAPYSSTGSYIDLAAPGGDMADDLNDDGYGDGILQQTFRDDPDDFGFWFMQGTSMAAPHVSGAAALLIAQGVTHPDAVRAALEHSAVDLGLPGWDTEFGWGLVDIGTALTYASPVVVTQTDP